MIAGLESAHKRIADLQIQEMEAIVRGDLAAAGSLLAELRVQREQRESISAELKTHVAEHGC